MEKIYKAILVCVALLAPCQSKPNHLLYAQTQRLSWAWVETFVPELSVPSGLDYFKENIVTTYVCRVSWDTSGSDIRVGKFSPESNCCSFTNSKGGEECLENQAQISDGQTVKVEHLVKPVSRSYYTDAEWIFTTEGVVHPSMHHGLILGGVKAFQDELVCRFNATHEGKNLTLQGNIPSAATECRGPFGVDDPWNLGETRSTSYELLVYT